MKQKSERMKVNVDILKHKIINNVDKYIENINDNKNSRIEVIVKKTNTITSYSEHFDCYIKVKSEDSGVIKKYLFAKHSGIEEYNNLLKIQKLYKDAKMKLKIPKPLDYFKNSKILIMEGTKGENFLLFLLKNLFPGFFFFSKNEIEDKIRLCASWLAEFHNIAYVEDSLNLNDEIELASSRLDYVPEFKDKKNALKEFLLKSKEKIGSTPISLTHRDFSARNIIFVNNNDIMVVDWAKVLRKNIYYSIAYFITNLEGRKRHLIYSFAPIKKLESLFLTEYEKRTRLNFNISTYKTFKKLYYIEYLYEYYTGTGVFEEWTRKNRRMQKFIGKIVDKLLNDIS